MKMLVPTIYAILAFILLAYGLRKCFFVSTPRESDIVEIVGTPQNVKFFQITARGRVTDVVQFKIDGTRFEYTSRDAGFANLTKAIRNNQTLTVGIIPGRSKRLISSMFYRVRVDGRDVVPFRVARAQDAKGNTALIVVSLVVGGLFGCLSLWQFLRPQKNTGRQLQGKRSR